MPKTIETYATPTNAEQLAHAIRHMILDAFPDAVTSILDGDFEGQSAFTVSLIDEHDQIEYRVLLEEGDAPTKRERAAKKAALAGV